MNIPGGLAMTRNISEILSQMTLEEKAGLCSGRDWWWTKTIPRLGIPSIMMTDGPHGLRKQSGQADHLGINESVPAVCFPTAAGLASSWDRELLEKLGMALGEECQAENVAILLGPGVNIKRSPLCGRNFEYFSEDPYLASKLAAGYIKGVQSQGVGVSLKHFAVNNQEDQRFVIDVIIDERSLREIYLASFEAAVKQAQPWTVMCAYNKVNGEYCSENRYVLTDILKNEWGHQGFVVSDWGAVNDRARGLAAGLELEMPSSQGYGEEQIVAAVKSGKLSEQLLDNAVARLLTIIFKAADSQKKNATYDREAHHRLAREIARESMVLLKNDDNILPLQKAGTLAIIGAFAKHPRYQGSGSSRVNPIKLDNVFEEIALTAGSEVKLLYADGYSPDNDQVDEGLIHEAETVASRADIAVIFAGLPDRYESEGDDRQHLMMPENQNQLIEAVAKVQPNVVVVLSNGAPVEMAWLNRVKGLLEAYLGGEALGGAIADLLFGVANPCGKLAETFPKRLADNPSYLNFPGNGQKKVIYGEGLFMGYRYYDVKRIEPLFPFGYGLSYTSFEYSGFSVDKTELTDRDTLKVSVKIKNTGKVAGKEIVQLYIRDIACSVIRPEKELKGFEKVELRPGEEKIVNFTLDKRAFAFYNPEIKDWYVESGDFEILIGKSSLDILLRGTVNVTSTAAYKKTYNRNSTFSDLMSNPDGAEVGKKLLQELEMEVPEAIGLNELPLRIFLMLTDGKITEQKLAKLLDELNNK